MAKVSLQYYNGKRKSVSLSMPWLKEPLAWHGMGDTIEVHSDDADRLLATESKVFRVVPRTLIPETFVEVLEEGPPWYTPPNDLQCPYCDHKPYKRQDFYDRHIANKHPEQLAEVDDGNDNSE